MQKHHIWVMNKVVLLDKNVGKIRDPEAMCTYREMFTTRFSYSSVLLGTTDSVVRITFD